MTDNNDVLAHIYAVGECIIQNRPWSFIDTTTDTRYLLSNNAPRVSPIRRLPIDPRLICGRVDATPRCWRCEQPLDDRAYFHLDVCSYCATEMGT